MVNQSPVLKPKNHDDFTVIWAATILPGKSEKWRRFAQEIVGQHQSGFAAMCQRLGIEAARAWIVETAKGDVGVIAVIADQPAEILRQVATANGSFEHWLRSQLQTLQGVDITQPPTMAPSDLVLDWQAERR